MGVVLKLWKLRWMPLCTCWDFDSSKRHSPPNNYAQRLCAVKTALHFFCWVSPLCQTWHMVHLWDIICCTYVFNAYYGNCYALIGYYTVTLVTKGVTFPPPPVHTHFLKVSYNIPRLYSRFTKSCKVTKTASGMQCLNCRKSHFQASSFKISRYNPLGSS